MTPEEFFNTISLLNDDALILVDPDGVVALANAKAISLFGDRILNNKLEYYLRHPDIAALLKNTRLHGVGGELSYVRNEEVQREYIVRLAPLVENYVITCLVDMTARSSIDKVRSDFVANVSHELRSPLTALSGFIETLQTTAADDRQSRIRFLDIMSDEADRMRRLINSLLSLSKVEAQEHMLPQNSVSIVDIVREVADTLSHRAAIREMAIALDFEASPAAPMVLGQKDELIEVFHNLIDNAIKYGTPETDVRVRFEHPVADREMVKICIINKGDGIEERHIPRLTERFYRVDKARTRKLGGTGLGLAIVKHIVNRHRGHLHITSEREGETVFAITLPTLPTLPPVSESENLNQMTG